MAVVDKIRNRIIDKILTIKDKEVLESLDRIINSTSIESGIIELSEEQKLMLEMSDEDIKKGRLISQDAMIKRNLEWLNAL